MNSRPLVFCDANIPFSAALGGPAFTLLLTLARDDALQLTTSQACVVEAAANLERKRPEHAATLTTILGSFTIEPDIEQDEHTEWASTLIHSDDIHVLAAARRANADLLLTGDTTHFGPLMERHDLPLRITTLRALLLETT